MWATILVKVAAILPGLLELALKLIEKKQAKVELRAAAQQARASKTSEQLRAASARLSKAASHPPA
jgi:hypothetical protein